MHLELTELKDRATAVEERLNALGRYL